MERCEVFWFRLTLYFRACGEGAESQETLFGQSGRTQPKSKRPPGFLSTCKQSNAVSPELCLWPNGGTAKRCVSNFLSFQFTQVLVDKACTHAHAHTHTHTRAHASLLTHCQVHAGHEDIDTHTYFCTQSFRFRKATRTERRKKRCGRRLPSVCVAPHTHSHTHTH